MRLIQNYLRTTTNSWRNQSQGLRIMRFWLGATWIYAGWDKATDPGFLAADSASYIGSQLSGYATQSPVGFAFNKLIEHAAFVGGFVMISEFAIGVATLLWVAPRVAAFGGFAMSIGLWLASSFHVSPYFLASDSAYAVLWFSYLLLLSGNRKRKGFEMSLERRGALRVGLTGAIAVGLAGFGKVFAKAAPSTSNSAASNTANRIIKLASLKVGATHKFVAKNGAPAIVFRTKTGVFAYSAICTHQGCTVAYSSSTKTLKCPCHGAEFDPYKSAQVINGPAQSPLAKVKVAVSGAWVVLV